jgi:hypothetical protein
MTAAATNSAKRERMKEPFSRGSNYPIGRRFRATSSDQRRFICVARGINKRARMLSNGLGGFPPSHGGRKNQGGLLTPFAVVARFESHCRAGRDRETACHRHFAGVSPGRGPSRRDIEDRPACGLGRHVRSRASLEIPGRLANACVATYAAPAVQTGGILPVEEHPHGRVALPAFSDASSGTESAECLWLAAEADGRLRPREAAMDHYGDRG